MLVPVPEKILLTNFLDMLAVKSPMRLMLFFKPDAPKRTENLRIKGLSPWRKGGVSIGEMKRGMRKILPRELAFDIDGVIADSFRAFVKTAREKYGIDIEYEDITDYDFRQVIDIDEETSNEIIEMILDDPFGMGIHPIHGAAEVLRRLSGFGPLFFVTARTNREAILEWLQKRLGLGNGDAIKLEATGSHEDKLPILLQNRIRYFVEDRLETCYLIQESPVTPIVFEQPWNRKAHPFHSVASWGEINEMVDWGIK